MLRINLGDGELAVSKLSSGNLTRLRFDAFPGQGFERGTPTCSHRFLELELQPGEVAQLVKALQEA